jgi:2-succinyl-6-hydroxy-2,4-cyclohexadiene-1-carboxylate synthase
VTHRAERHDIDVGRGVRLRVESSGDGPPVVLLHGFTGSTATWTTLRTMLDDRFTTIAVDFPGHGGSSVPDDPGSYALERFADDLALALDVLHVERAALLGYSMGGRAALRFLMQHSARVAALVLESTSPGIVDPAERAGRLAADAALADVVERDGVAAFVDRWERLPLWTSQRALPEETRARLRAQRLRNSARGLANTLRGASAGADAPLLGALPSFTTPALLVAGALDTKYVDLARRMQIAMQCAELAVIPGAGHNVHLERPAAFTEVVRKFLDRVAM